MINIKHKDYYEILNLISLKENLWIFGEPGTGKSFIVRQIADYFRIPYSQISCGPSLLIEDIFGFVNIHGDTKLTNHALAMEQPGITILEEIDLLNNKVQNQLNTILEERTIEIGDRKIKVHPKHVIIGTGNTDGVNNDEWTTRTQADESLLSRFLRYKLDFDANLELSIFGTIYLRKWAKGLAKLFKVIRTKQWVTTRLGKKIMNLLKLFSPTWICNNLLLKVELDETIRDDSEIQKAIHDFCEIPWEAMIPPKNNKDELDEDDLFQEPQDKDKTTEFDENFDDFKEEQIDLTSEPDENDEYSQTTLAHEDTPLAKTTHNNKNIKAMFKGDLTDD